MPLYYGGYRYEKGGEISKSIKRENMGDDIQKWYNRGNVFHNEILLH